MVHVPQIALGKRVGLRFLYGRGVVRRIWAPRGQTPIQYSWDRHDRLSAISAITVSAVRRRFGIYFHIYPENIHSEEVEVFLKHFHRHLGRKVILVLDRCSVHRKAVRALREKHPDWLDVEWLPAYAPELDPVEGIWNRAKYADLANFIPEDVDELYDAVTTSIDDVQSNQDLIRSFFQHAELKL